MGRFADPFATETFRWSGGCQCPGEPHEFDEAEFRVSLGASALARIGRAEIEGAVTNDPYAAHRQLVIESVVSWNLLWLAPLKEGDTEEDRKPVPVAVNPVTVAELGESIIELAQAIDARISGGPPNDSSVPSQASPQGSASPTRKKIQTRGT